MSDPNDTLRSGGPDAVRAGFDKIVPLRTLDGVVFQGDAPIEPPVMLVKGILPFEGIAFIGGQSGAGKTYITIDLAMAIATGSKFFGRSISERKGVFIIAAEGAGMIKYRVEAARQSRVLDDRKVPVAWTSEVPQLSSDADIKRFAAKVELVSQQFEKEHGVRLGVLMIDTVSAVFRLENENDNSEVARAIAKMRELARKSGAVIMPIHHFGKSTLNGLRGGSAWRDGADVVLAVLVDQDTKTRRLEIDKARDGPDGPIAPFAFRWLQLGVSDDGEPYGSHVVEPLLGRAGSISARAANGAGDGRMVRAVRDAFIEALDAHGMDIRIGGSGPVVRGVRLTDVRVLFDRRYATAEDNPAKAAARARMAFMRGLEKLASEIWTQKVDGVDWGWKLKG